MPVQAATKEVIRKEILELDRKIEELERLLVPLRGQRDSIKQQIDALVAEIQDVRNLKQTLKTDAGL